MHAHDTGETALAITDGPQVIVTAGANLFAIPALSVQAMVRMPEVVHTPGAPTCVRGVVNLRGRVLPVIDLRLRCGMQSLLTYVSELSQTLEKREQDHVNWLAELEKSVTDRRAFSLTTDPHQCAFGKWYDAFHTDDLILASLLKEFDAPHQAIHAAADVVRKHVDAGDFAAANAVIEQRRTSVLARLRELFAATRAHLSGSTREIAVVIEGNGNPFGLAVDRVESVEKLEPATIAQLPAIMTQISAELFQGTARRRKGNDTVLLLKPGALSAAGTPKAA
ncbi:MAG: chemotaxis protein CheW [Phycisphaerae bacterium]